MMELLPKERAFIISKKGNIVFLLHEKEGKIEGLIFDNACCAKLSSGSRIAFRITQKRGNRPVLEDVTLEDMPLACGQQDIYFLHSVLEVCLYYAPVGSGGSVLFENVELILRYFSQIRSLLARKMIICKLFAHLGIYPDHEQFNFHALLLLKTPVDKIEVIDLQLIVESILDQWVMWSIQCCPQGKWLKVLPLLLKSDAP